MIKWALNNYYSMKTATNSRDLTSGCLRMVVTIG